MDRFSETAYLSFFIGGNVMANSNIEYQMSRLISNTTRKCIEKMDLQDMTLEDIASAVMEEVTTAFAERNNPLDKPNRWKAPISLNHAQIADIILAKCHVIKIACSGLSANEELDILAFYREDGPNKGTYATDLSWLNSIARQLEPNVTTKVINEIIAALRSEAKRVEPCEDRDLIAVNNGVFDYETKDLLPFSPDMVFLTKSRVDYVPGAANPTIHNTDDNTDWDVESWMQELSDDPEIVNLLWEILGAVIRPCVRWNKSAWFYSETGNNGKGTLCELMRQLCGDGNVASVPISDFGNDFALEQLIHSSAIIVDENDVGTYIDKTASLKAVITGDVLSINRKHKQAIPFRFRGFMVQCLNEMPRVKDKSDSFYRRQLFIQFTKCFTGSERKYIKDDYLHRQEVLEYVLCRVLNMNYYTLSEPATCKIALNEYKAYNDPVRQFVEEIFPQLQWDLEPFEFLYVLYKAWLKESVPSGTPLSKKVFIDMLRKIIQDDPNSEWSVSTDSIRTGKKMDAVEPLICQYDLKDWMDPTYTGNDPSKKARPPLKEKYRGIYRNGNN